MRRRTDECVASVAFPLHAIDAWFKSDAASNSLSIHVPLSRPTDMVILKFSPARSADGSPPSGCATPLCVASCVATNAVNATSIAVPK